jgi:hypothetical protein
MKTKDKEKILRKKLLYKIQKLNLPPFINQEIKKILNLLNLYKLENLQKNFPAFEKFLLQIKQEYINTILKNI